MILSRKKLFIFAGIFFAVLILPPILYAILLSQFAVRNLWFPVLHEKTGYKIDAAECRVSLFGTQTCLFRKIKGSGNHIDFTADMVAIEMDPFALIFDRNLKIDKAEIDGLNLKTEIKQKKTQEYQEIPSAKTTATLPEQKKNVDEPFRWSLKQLQLSNSSMEIKNSEEIIHIENLGIQIRNLLPGERGEICMEGFSGISGKNEILRFPFKSNIALKIPDDGSFPETLLAVCNTEKFRISRSSKDEFTAKFLLNIQKKTSTILIQEISFALEAKDAKFTAFAKGELPSSFDWNQMIYSGNMKMNKFQLAPIGDALNGGKESGVSGEISSADLKFSGKGVTSPVWQKNLKAEFSAKTRGISFPASLEKASPSARMVLTPLHSLQSLLKILDAQKKLPAVYELSGRISRVLSGRENMKLNKGTVLLSASNGILSIRKCRFEGGTCKRESVEGTINLVDEKLKLYAEIDAEDLVIPAMIRGTISRPKLDYKRTYKKLRKEHLKDLLKSENAKETVKKANQLINIFLEQ